LDVEVEAFLRGKSQGAVGAMIAIVNVRVEVDIVVALGSECLTAICRQKGEN